MKGLSIRLLGTRRVEHDGRPFDLPARHDTLRLLACLLMRSDRALSRAEISAMLWPESDASKALYQLRQSLHRLRRWLPDSGDAEWIEIDGDRIAWNASTESWSDIQTLQRAAGDSQIPRQQRLVELRDAVALCNGPLLPGLEDPWTLEARDELMRCQRRVLARLGGALEDMGDHMAAAEQSRALLSLDPTNEPAHRRLMRLHAARADRAALLAQARACEQALRRHLDGQPSLETRALLDQLLAKMDQRTGAIGKPGPPVGGGSRLQEPEQDYASRVDHLDRAAACREALGETRLLTIWGPGGIGKSRLARDCLLGARERSAVTVVDLDGATDALPVLGRIAQATGTDLPLPGAIAQQIGRDEQVLLLDDCEQVSAILAEVAERLLGLCRGLRLVVTSRERLRVPGELAWSLPRLSLEGSSDAASGEAGMLLTRGLGLDEVWPADQAEALARIATSLDGLPRPLLQAGQALRKLAPLILAAELETELGRLDELASLDRERFGDLASSFDHDLQRLDVGPRKLLARLAAADQPMGLQALVLPAPGADSAGPPISPAELIAQLGELRDRSLIEVETGGDGNTAYRLLNGTRQLARARLLPPGPREPR